MSATERVVQSILYELGCVLIGCLVMQFVPHEGQPYFVQNSESACGFSQSTPLVAQRPSDILGVLITFLSSPLLVYHDHDL